MFKFINQECDISCTVACVAMVAGVSFKVAKGLFDKIPAPALETDIALVRLGLLPVHSIYNKLEYDKIYIMEVPSLNKSRHNHTVVVCTHSHHIKVYDPQRGRPGKKFYCYSALENQEQEYGIIGWGTIVEIIDTRQ